MLTCTTKHNLIYCNLQFHMEEAHICFMIQSIGFCFKSNIMKCILIYTQVIYTDMYLKIYNLRYNLTLLLDSMLLENIW